MINDLPESFQSSALFADDGEDGNIIEKLDKMAQNFLNKIIEVWCKKNGITISNAKSTAIVFTKNEKIRKLLLPLMVVALKIANK